MFESMANENVGILILVLISYFMGIIVSDFLNRRSLRRIDEKYTYINEIFKVYLESTSKADNK